MIRACALALLFAVPAALAADEMWRWIEEDGTPHYTNDKSTIPAKYKAKAARTTGGEIGVVNVKEGDALDSILDSASADNGSAGTAVITDDDLKAPRPGAPQKYANEVKQVLVFGAPWCQPCLMMKKQGTLDQLVKANAGLKLREVDIDQKPEVAKKYDVNAVPTVVFTDGEGKELLRVRGPKTLDQFKRALALARGAQVE